MVKVKICGITNLEDALASVEFGADMLGFNFYEKSRRCISPQKALDIVTELPSDVQKIGVFVNEPIEGLLTIVDDVGLDAIQLHGDEDIAYLSDLKKMSEKIVIKAFRVSPNFDLKEALGWPWDFPLFDAYSAGQYGGTGEAFDWEDFGSQSHRVLPHSAFIAGGLNPDNVVDAVRLAFPYAVDVASGVESSPGKKDRKKLETFIRNAKNA